MEDVSLLRLEVFRYEKSGKHVAFHTSSSWQEKFAIDFSQDLQNIEKVRSVKSLRASSLLGTEFLAELVCPTHASLDGDDGVSYRLVRILKTADLDPRKWRPEIPLEDLVLSPCSLMTPEEASWAGKRSGTFFSGAAAATLAIGLCGWGLYIDSWFVGLAGVGSAAYSVAQWPWHKAKDGDPERLSALRDAKSRILEDRAADFERSLSEFSEALQRYETWVDISPQEFEVAVKVKLEELGWKLKVTPMSGDGGIDLEGEDDCGVPVIVQAKQYAKKVGIAVVREMVGVKQARADAQRVIIYSLAGLTRGAREEAAERGIELMDVRKDVLGLS